ncbi:MAG: DUF4403 family protein [Nitrospira sp.]|nr:DUF4403 family protein [Nitrospira sp.]
MKCYTRSIIPALLPIALFGGACSHSIPQAATKPVPPPVTSAVPSFAALNKEQPKAPLSQVPFQIKTDLTPVQTAIRNAIPERFTEAGHPLERDFRWTFVRSGDPQVRIQDGLVAVHAEYKGDIEARGGSRACRLDPVYSTMDAMGKLVLLQDHESVALGFEPSQVNVGLKPESDARCNMFNIPVKDQLPELFALTEAKTALAEAVQPDTFKIPFQRLWDDVAGPLSLPVSSLNTRACLYGNPREVTLGQQKGTTKDTIISGVAKQMPVITFEQACSEQPPTTALVNSGTVPPDTKPYMILAKIPVSYTNLSHQLQSKLFHQTLMLDSSASETALIERVVATDANGRVLVAVDTTGDLKGTIYYWGTPHLDDGGKSLSIPDLQMANESKTAIDSIRVGYWQLVDRELKNRLRQAATTDLSAQIDRMKQVITGGHTSGNVTTNILVTGQQPDQVQSTPQAVIATILLQGTASATGQVMVEDNGARALLKKEPH